MAKEDYKGIWVFAEQQNRTLNPVTYELLAKAQELKAHNGEAITAVLLGSKVAHLAAGLIAGGADQAIVAEHENLASYSARPYQQALTELAEKYKPSIIMYPATSLGRDFAPRMMISLKTGLTADAIDLGYDEDDVFYQTTPAYGGSILAHIVILECRPQMVTVRPKIFTPLEPDESRKGEVITEHVTVDKEACYEVLNVEPKVVTGVPIDHADVLVAGGRGVKDESELALLKELADLLGGQLVASRPLVDNGFLPHDAQIGQSGTAVKPNMIINVAISGSVQYQVGMQNAKCIVSINHNAASPIFDISHYGAVADFKAVLPAVIAEIKNRRT